MDADEIKTTIQSQSDTIRHLRVELAKARALKTPLPAHELTRPLRAELAELRKSNKRLHADLTAVEDLKRKNERLRTEIERLREENKKLRERLPDLLRMFAEIIEPRGRV